MLCENRSDCPQFYPSYNEHGHLHTVLAPSRLSMAQSRLALLPSWLSHWLGYRSSPPPKHPNYVIWIWSFIGAFGGLSILQASLALSPRSYSLMASLDWAGCLRSCTLFHRAKRAKCYRQLCPSFFREVGGNARKNLFIIRAPPRSSAMAQLKSHSHNHARLSAVISFPHS